MKSNYYFKCLERHEIMECTKMLARIFTSFDPFISELQIPESDLYKIIQSELEEIVDSNLVTICKSNENKIIGCYAGFKLINIKEKNFKSSKFNIYKINDENLKIEDKLAILKDIDFNILKDFYEGHRQKNELEISIFCDYFCISEEYFQSNLARDLALNFFLNCKNMGIHHIYGTFFNIKAIKLLTKHFPAEIVNEIEIVFVKKDGKKMDYKVLLLYGNLNLKGFDLEAVVLNPKL